MTIQQFIEKAIEGGWYGDHVIHRVAYDEVVLVHREGNKIPVRMQNATFLLDPLAWKAVGKVCGWVCKHCSGTGVAPNHDECFSCRGSGEGKIWLENMHCMIDSLAEGKTIEEFISTL